MENRETSGEIFSLLATSAAEPGHNALATGPSLAGGPLVPGPPFEIGAPPHFTFGPSVAAYV